MYHNKLLRFFGRLYLHSKYYLPLPDSIIIKLDCIIYYGKKINISNPRTFNEKLQWMKLYGNMESLSIYADKLEVRKYVKEIIGDNYLVPLLRTWDNVKDIRKDDIPDSCVLKMTHGSGYNIIIKNKNGVNLDAVIKKLKKWEKLNYYRFNREPQYKNIKPRVICEKYLEDSNGELIDYKVHCFNDEPKIISVHLNRFKDHKINYYDPNWNRFHFTLLHPGFDQEIKRPDTMDEMLQVAKKLSVIYPLVRIDLFDVDGRIYFGEITFAPHAGFHKPNPKEYDNILGDMIKLQ